MYKLKIMSKGEKVVAYCESVQEVANQIKEHFNVNTLADLLKAQKEAQVRIYLTYQNR